MCFMIQNGWETHIKSNKDENYSFAEDGDKKCRIRRLA